MLVKKWIYFDSGAKISEKEFKNFNFINTYKH